MPLVLLALGGLLILSAIKGTEHDLGAQLQADFTGQGSFLYWIASIGLIGALGLVPVLRTPSRWLIALIMIAMLFANRGVFAALLQAIGSPTAAQSRPLPTSSSGSNGGSGGGSTSASNGIGGINVADAAKLALLFV